MILTVGGSGTLGRIVARQLLAGGESVRLMTRRPSTVEWARNAGAEVVPGDLLDSASLVRACTGRAGGRLRGAFNGRTGAERLGARGRRRASTPD